MNNMIITQCKTLEEVRLSIDLIDEKIVELLAERSCYVKQAVKFKKTESEVEAPKRVEDVISRIRNLSIASELDANVGEKIFRAIISTFVAQEKSTLNNTNGK